jgi:hypothetical protein
MHAAELVEPAGERARPCESHGVQALAPAAECVLAGHSTHSVARGGANVPAGHWRSTVAFGHEKPSLHGRQEMGELVRLFMA